MYSLTKEQKLENYVELLRIKKEKVENLLKEIENLQKKIEKLSSTKN